MEEKMEEQNNLSNQIKNIYKIFFNISSTIAWLIIFSILLLGAMFSFVLFVSQFPKEAATILKVISPIFRILIVFFMLSLGGGIYVWLLYLMFKSFNKKKQLRLEQREKFKEEIFNYLLIKEEQNARRRKHNTKTTKHSR